MSRYTTDKKYAERSLASANRRIFRLELCMAWIRENRADIYAQIEAAAEKKFPYSELKHSFKSLIASTKRGK